MFNMLQVFQVTKCIDNLKLHKLDKFLNGQYGPVKCSACFKTPRCSAPVSLSQLASRRRRQRYSRVTHDTIAGVLSLFLT